MLLFPYVETKRTVLRPVYSPDGTPVYDSLHAAGVAGLPDRALFEIAHCRGVAAQFLVEYGGDVIGVSTLHHLDQAGQHIQADILTDTDRARHGVSVEANLMTINYAFTMWNIRKVYFWTRDETSEALGSTPSMFRHEGTLRHHFLVDGDLVDAHVYAVYREQWLEFGIRILERIVQGPRVRTNFVSPQEGR